MKVQNVVLAALGVGGIIWVLRRQYPEETAAVVEAAQEAIVEPIKTVISGVRGLRNNNPGNIERTRDQWRGMSADQSADSRFVVFDAPVWGLRAIARLIRKYNASGLLSVQQIIGKWAPSSENDTNAYAQAVARRLGVSPTQPLVLTDDVLSGIMQAIVQHENGQQPYPSELFAQAIQLERSA